MLTNNKFKSRYNRHSIISNFTPGNNINRFQDRLNPAFKRVAEGEFENIRRNLPPRAGRMAGQFAKGDSEGAFQTAVEMGADAGVNYARSQAAKMMNRQGRRTGTKQSQGQRQSTGQKTKTKTGMSGSNRGGGKNRSSGRPSKYAEPSKTPRGVVGYNPFMDTPSGSPVRNQYPEFNAFYHMPIVAQVKRTTEGESVNFCKTMITSVSTAESNLMQDNFPNDQRVPQADLMPIVNALNRVYTEAKIQAISNTNGGRAATVTLTKEMFFNYLQVGMSACAIIAQLNSLMGWDPPYAESNSCIRSLSNKMNSSIALRVAKGALEEALAALALPRPLKEYYRELFQVYKTSPIDGGAHHFFCEYTILYDISRQQEDFDQTINHINNIIDDINGANFNDYATITALLKDKTYFTYDSMRDLIPMPDSPSYSPRQATLFNNTPWYGTTNATPPIGLDKPMTMFSGGLSHNNTAHLVSAMGTDEISCYEIAPLIQLFGETDPTVDTMPYYFAFKFDRRDSMDNSNRFYLTDNQDEGLNVELRNVIQTIDDLLDFRVSLQCTMFDNTAQLYEPMVVPKGENVRLYQASLQPLVAATVNMIYKTMDISSSKLM